MIWATAAVASLAVHLLWTWHTHDGTHVARCGATWVIFAGAIIGRPIIRMGYKMWYQSTRTIDAGTFETTPDQVEEIKQNAIDANCVQVLGPLLAALGTLLWAYGDLAANLIMKWW
jgi:Na+/glutamate symporter